MGYTDNLLHNQKQELFEVNITDHLLITENSMYFVHGTTILLHKVLLFCIILYMHLD